MSFNFYLIKGIRFLLFPFSLLVWGYLRVRNWCYNTRLLKSTSFNIPLIGVGNLNVGGTGKSPMVEYLLGQLQHNYRLATLSRGYKRKTKGYILAGQQTTALEIGDEPMQFHRKFPEVAVAVGEERLVAIPMLLQDKPMTEVIILDDAFQHRAVKAGFNILLTDYGNPYWLDWYLPTGDLRDNKRSAAAAQVIVVTKCPPDLSAAAREAALDAIQPLDGQQVFFTTIRYGTPYHILNKSAFELAQNLEVLLICGIANPAPLKAYIEKNSAAYLQKNYSDHHIFSIDDWRDIETEFSKLEGHRNIMLTTEKDAVRLMKFGNLLEDRPLYVLPVKHEFLFNGGENFNALVTGFINNFQKSTTIPAAG